MFFGNVLGILPVFTFNSGVSKIRAMSCDYSVKLPLRRANKKQGPKEYAKNYFGVLKKLICTF